MKPKDNFITHPRAKVHVGANILTTEGKRLRRRVGVWLLFVFAIAVAHPLQAFGQQNSAVPIQPTVLRWWHGAVFLGGLSALMLLDNSVQDYAQDHRSERGDEVSGTIRHFGQVEVFGTITAGVVAGGLISGNHEVTRTGLRLATTLVVAGATSTLAKLAFGRPRPADSFDADGYVPFSGQEAMPSGHTTMAFAFATTLADDIHRTWASVGLYTLAGGVAWSRINDNRHWLTDVVAGAAIGITSSKLVSGRWQIFGLRPPEVLIGSSPALAWNIAF
jgi:membrane-associated phospholipid phosphatase